MNIKKLLNLTFSLILLNSCAPMTLKEVFIKVNDLGMQAKSELESLMQLKGPYNTRATRFRYSYDTMTANEKEKACIDMLLAFQELTNKIYPILEKNRSLFESLSTLRQIYYQQEGYGKPSISIDQLNKETITGNLLKAEKLRNKIIETKNDKVVSYLQVMEMASTYEMLSHEDMQQFGIKERVCCFFLRHPICYMVKQNLDFIHNAENGSCLPSSKEIDLLIKHTNHWKAELIFLGGKELLQESVKAAKEMIDFFKKCIDRFEQELKDLQEQIKRGVMIKRIGVAGSLISGLMGFFK